MKVETVYTGYYPRPIQASLHASLKRFNVIVCHRRFGKTVFAVNELLDQALRCTKHNPVYAYLGPTYGSVERVAWTMMKEYTSRIPGVETNEQKLRIVIDRPAQKDKITILLLGAENPGNLKGIYLDGVILDEFAECTPDVWTEVVRPMLSDRGGWAIFIGTPKGMNHFHDIYRFAGEEKAKENWFRCVYKASETNILPSDELEDAKGTMPEEKYQQEFECSFNAALVGAYYGKQIQKAEDEKRITNVPWDRSSCVDTYWDLGVGDSTAIWFIQMVGREYHIIDYLEMSGVGLDWYAKELKERPYVYDEHVLPHDAGQMELGSGGATRVQSLKNLGLRNVRVLERPKGSAEVDEGIHKVRMILDKCWFDQVKCKRGLEALKAYERKWDSKNKIFSEKPLHNWASHGADAFRVFGTGVRDASRKTRAKDLRPSAQNTWDPFGR